MAVGNVHGKHVATCTLKQGEGFKKGSLQASFVIQRKARERESERESAVRKNSVLAVIPGRF